MAVGRSGRSVRSGGLAAIAAVSIAAGALSLVLPATSGGQAAAPVAGQKRAQPARATPPGGRESGILVDWWKRADFCSEIGLTPAQVQKLAAGLEALQTSYQLVQTRLTDARTRQTTMMFDAGVDRGALAAFNRDQVAALTDQMQSLNFEARMLVRGDLTPAQLQALAKSKPHFFTARWFRLSPVPVREGTVVLPEE